MVKNLIQEQLDLIEKLLDAVNSKEEYDYLLSEKKKLLRQKYPFKFNKYKAPKKAPETIVSQDFIEEYGNEMEDYLQSYPFKTKLAGGLR